MEFKEEDYAFDFGFTAVTEQELSVVSDAKSEAEETSEKLLALRKMIQPLLENLKKNPEKDYIYWPNRTATIDAFIEKINKIETI